jgi:arsenate reductase
MDIKIYHNRRCSKSRQTLALLEKETTDFKIIEYLKNPLSFDEIKEIIEKLAIKPIDLIRKNEEIWRDNYKRKEMTDVEIIRAMEGNPKLIERPIVINEKNGIIGRPPEKVLSLFT